jgi:hypothetical protein
VNRSGRRKWLWRIAGGIFVLWVLAAAASLWSARADARSGVDRLERARNVLTPDGIVHGAGVPLLEGARDDFAAARDKVRSPIVAPLRVLPVIGRQVRAVDDMTAAAADVVDTGVDAITGARAVLDGRQPQGGDRVALTNEIGAIATRSSARLDRVDLGEGDHLVGPLRDARERFEDELGRLRDAAHRVRTSSVGFAHFLQGPSRYLVLAANNNEMRVGSGSFLSAGVLTVEGGEFEVGDFTPTREYLLPPGTVPLAGDFAQRWGWLHPSEEWRNLGASPRFGIQAALAQKMWKAAMGEDVDGVMVLDPVALRSLLKVTGPVEVDGQSYGERNVLDAIYIRQYLDVEGVPEEEDRRDRLSAIAKAAINRLDEGGWNAADLVEALRDAAEGRHVLMWSPHPDQQAGWRAAGVGGQLRDTSLLVGVFNSGGNKLDRFLEISADVETEPAPVPAPRGSTEVRVRLELHNTVPEGLPQYIAGPFPRAQGGEEGKYQGYVTFEMPRYTQKFFVTDDFGERLRPVTQGADGDSWVIAVYTELRRDDSTIVTAHFVLPPSAQTVRVEPSARYPVVRWRFRGDEWRDTSARSIEWAPWE